MRPLAGLSRLMGGDELTMQDVRMLALALMSALGAVSCGQRAAVDAHGIASAGGGADTASAIVVTAPSPLNSLTEPNVELRVRIKDRAPMHTWVHVNGLKASRLEFGDGEFRRIVGLPRPEGVIRIEFGERGPGPVEERVLGVREIAYRVSVRESWTAERLGLWEEFFGEDEAKHEAARDALAVSPDPAEIPGLCVVLASGPASLPRRVALMSLFDCWSSLEAVPALLAVAGDDAEPDVRSVAFSVVASTMGRSFEARLNVDHLSEAPTGDMLRDATHWYDANVERLRAERSFDAR